MDEIKLGKFIAKLRNEKHLTQDELAEKLGYDNSKKISRWECGNSVPDFNDLIRLSQILDVTLYELSICKKITDKSILDATKDRLKNIKDFKRMTNHKRALILIAVLFGLLFGMTTLYTIENYNTVEIYQFKSLSDQYCIKGNYIKTKNHQIFDVTNLTYLNSDINKYDINVHGVEYQILQNNEVLFKIPYNQNMLKKYFQLIDIINSTSFSGIVNREIKIKNNTLTFQIIYIDNNDIKNIIEFNLELQKIFANNFKGI